MAKPEWGMKHECPNCSVRFYDMQKPSPITCISCGYEFAIDVLHRVRKTKISNEDDADLSDHDEIDTDVESDDIDPTEDLLLHDEDDDEESIKESTDMSNFDDDMFPDDEDDSDNPEELPEDILGDDDIDADDEEAPKA